MCRGWSSPPGSRGPLEMLMGLSPVFDRGGLERSKEASDSPRPEGRSGWKLPAHVCSCGAWMLVGRRNGARELQRVAVVLGGTAGSSPPVETTRQRGLGLARTCSALGPAPCSSWSFSAGWRSVLPGEEGRALLPGQVFLLLLVRKKHPGSSHLPPRSPRGWSGSGSVSTAGEGSACTGTPVSENAPNRHRQCPPGSPVSGVWGEGAGSVPHNLPRNLLRLLSRSCCPR